MKKISISGIVELIAFTKEQENKDNEVLTFGEILHYLNDNSIENIKRDIKSFKDGDLKPAVDALRNHYNVQVSSDFMRNVLLNNLELAIEMKNGAINDEYIRGCLFSASMREAKAFLPLSEDPTFYVRKNFKFPEDFFKNLEDLEKSVMDNIKSKIDSVGGKIIYE